MKRFLKDGLWPHEENNYAPTILRRSAMVAMCFLVMLSFLTTNLQALLWQSSDWLVGAILPAVVVDLTNQERQTLSAPPLVRSKTLDEAAKLKAEHMASNNYFAHNSPEGITPWHWFKVVNYTYAHAGENLAVHFSDSDEVVTAWMNSPTHRANIVNANYQEIGIGTARGRYQGYSTVFVVQLFGTRALPLPVLPSVTVPVAVNSEVRPFLIADQTTDNEPVSNDNVLGVDEITAVEEEEPAATPVALPPDTDALATEVVESETEANVLEANIDLAGEMEPVFLSLTATSSGLPPIVSSVDRLNGDSYSKIGKLATQPKQVLHYLYLTIGFFTTLALWSSVLLAWRRRQLVDVSYGLTLLLLMSGLFYVHQLLTSGAVIA